MFYSTKYSILLNKYDYNVVSCLNLGSTWNNSVFYGPKREKKVGKHCSMAMMRFMIKAIVWWVPKKGGPRRKALKKTTITIRRFALLSFFKQNSSFVFHWNISYVFFHKINLNVTWANVAFLLTIESQVFTIYTKQTNNE